MGLVPNPPGRVTGGEIWFNDAETIGEPVDLLRVPVKQLQNYRGDRLSMIFQEPMSSLNPVYTCGFQLTEAIRLHEKVSDHQAQRRAVSLLQEVQLLPPDDELKRRFLEEFSSEGTPPSQTEIDRQINRQKLAMLDRYPHELSGGQIQRVMIAMAISLQSYLADR